MSIQRQPTIKSGGPVVVTQDRERSDGRGECDVEVSPEPDERTKAEIDFLVSGATKLPGRQKKVEITGRQKAVPVGTQLLLADQEADELTLQEIQFLGRANPVPLDLFRMMPAVFVPEKLGRAEVVEKGPARQLMSEKAFARFLITAAAVALLSTIVILLSQQGALQGREVLGLLVPVSILATTSVFLSFTHRD